MEASRKSTIELLRHGETRGSPRFCGSTDVPLTELGWQQLRGAVEQNAEPWQRIISSPLLRCADFAHELASQFALPLSLDERFQEMHFGRWEGHTAAELWASESEALSLFWQDPKTNTPPLAETLLNFQARVLSAWHELLSRYPGERILLVTHGGVIRTILCHLRQHPIERLLEFQVDHASLFRIEVSGSAKEPRYTLRPEAS